MSNKHTASKQSALDNLQCRGVVILHRTVHGAMQSGDLVLVDRHRATNVGQYMVLRGERRRCTWRAAVEVFAIKNNYILNLP